jgi:hypothetical protein
MNAADGWNRQGTGHPAIILVQPPLFCIPYTEEIITASKMEARSRQKDIPSKHLVIPVRNAYCSPYTVNVDVLNTKSQCHVECSACD